MANENDEGGLIRRYLLGQISEDERQQLEEMMMSDDELYNRVLLAEDELVEEYVQGELSESERAGFEASFLSTPDGRKQVSFARALSRYASTAGLSEAQGDVVDVPRSGWRKQPVYAPYRKLAAAAAILLALGLGIWRVFFFQSDVSKGMAALVAAYREQRPLEARISGLSYAPVASTRGSDEKVNHLARDRAERILLDAVFESAGPGSRHALGRLYLAERQFDRAIAQFEEALKADPNNAQLHSDYGAALLEKGKVEREKGEAGDSLEAFAQSLDHLSKAIQLDATRLEPVFNRAILYRYMVLPDQAEEEWRTYLDRDTSSKWADEARLNLKSLEERKKARLEDSGELLAGFLEACSYKRDDTALELLSKNTEAITGQLLWWQLVGAYLEVSRRHNGDEGRYLEALSYGGALHEQKTGDRFISRLARFYGAVSFERQALLREAHRLIDQAHPLLARSETDRALELYQKAKGIFERAGDQMESEFADYYIGYSLYRKSEFKSALRVLSSVLKNAKVENSLWLAQCALTMIANLHLESGRFSSSLGYYKESLKISNELNDQYNAQRNLTSLAFGYQNLGNSKESFGYIQRCLRLAESHWSGARQMYRNFDTAAGIFNSFGHYAGAAAYEKAALHLALDAKDPGFQHLSYTQLSAIYAKVPDYAEALRYAEQGYRLANSMSGTRAILRPIAVSSLQLAHIYRQAGENDKAEAYYDDAIRLCGEIRLVAYLYEAHKGRLLCYIAGGDDQRAEQELQTVLRFFEEHRTKIREEKNRNSFFDLEQYVYDIAIDFEYSRQRDYRKAFEYAEASRARSLLDLIAARAEVEGVEDPDAVISLVTTPVTLTDITERLPAHGQILQYSALDDKLLIWVISKATFEVREYTIPLSQLTEKAVKYWEMVSKPSQDQAEDSRHQAIELYDILIKPVEPFLEKDAQICVVPDKALNHLPFNALISSSTGTYAVNDYLFSFAPSASTLLVSTAAAKARSGEKDERVLSVGNPRFSREAFPDLPEISSSEREAFEVSRCYQSRCTLVGENATKTRVWTEMPWAHVIHLASHYVIDDQNPMLSKLLLTRSWKEGSRSQVSDGTLQSHDIYRRKLPLTRLVVLSACRTGVERYYRGEGMIGMSRTFLIAGVPLVVASLWPVASDSTADLMIRFHRYRKLGGLPSVKALRQAQLDMMLDPQRHQSDPYFWAPFVMVGGLTDF